MKYATPRKKRKSKLITEMSEQFKRFIDEENYEMASKSVFLVVLHYAKDGILDAMKRANNYYKRLELRNGLK